MFRHNVCDGFSFEHFIFVINVKGIFVEFTTFTSPPGYRIDTIGRCQVSHNKNMIGPHFMGRQDRAIYVQSHQFVGI